MILFIDNIKFFFSLIIFMIIEFIQSYIWGRKNAAQSGYRSD